MQAPAYYIHVGGNDAGPYTLGQLRAMWNAGSITADAFVWWEGQADWQPITGMMPLLQDRSDVAALTQQPKPHAKTGRRVAVSNAAVWTAACSPILMILVGAVIGDSSRVTSYLLGAALLCVPVAVDITLLRVQGLRDETYWWLFGILLLAIVFVPVYLRQRAQTVGDGPAYFITALVCFIGLVILQITALATGA
jgi:GYF domain 2